MIGLVYWSDTARYARKHPPSRPQLTVEFDKTSTIIIHQASGGEFGGEEGRKYGTE